MQVELVSPEQVLYTGEAEMVVARTLGGGDIAFLPGHARFVGALECWPVRVIHGETQDHFAVHGGFVEVSGDTVTILSDVAELAREIDVARATEAKARAEAELRENPENPDAEAALRRAETRLTVAGS